MRISCLGMSRMCNRDLVCNSDLKLVFDNDCLASFIWIHRLDILETLYKGRMYVPQIVVDEFSFLRRSSKYKWVYEDLLAAIQQGQFTVIDIKVGDKAFDEYNRLRKQNKGKGESTAIAMRKQWTTIQPVIIYEI